MKGIQIQHHITDNAIEFNVECGKLSLRSVVDSAGRKHLEYMEDKGDYIEMCPYGERFSPLLIALNHYRYENNLA